MQAETPPPAKKPLKIVIINEVCNMNRQKQLHEVKIMRLCFKDND